MSERGRLEWYEELLSDHRPRYNVAPGQEMPIVRVTSEGRRVLQDLRWGLVPLWAANERMGYRMINARAETAHEAPAYRAAFERRRCIVPADGFYEWQSLGKGRPKQPYWAHRPDESKRALTRTCQGAPSRSRQTNPPAARSPEKERQRGLRDLVEIPDAAHCDHRIPKGLLRVRGEDERSMSSAAPVGVSETDRPLPPFRVHPPAGEVVGRDGVAQGIRAFFGIATEVRPPGAGRRGTWSTDAPHRH